MVVEYIGFHDGQPYTWKCDSISTVRDPMGVVWLDCLNKETLEQVNIPFYSLVNITA